MSIFSENIKHLRKEYGMTQGDLVEVLNYGSATTVSNWEKEGGSEPSFETLKRIAKVFHVSIDDLLKRDLTSKKYKFCPPNIAECIYRLQFPVLSIEDIGPIDGDDIDVIFASMKKDIDPITSMKSTEILSVFQRARAKHLSILQSILSVSESPVLSFDELDNRIADVEDLYEEAEEEDESLKFVVGFNKISLHFLESYKLMELGYMHDDSAVLHYKKKMRPYRASIPQGLMDSKSALALLRELNDNETQDEIMAFLKDAKQKREWYQYADYFLALRYLVGAVDSDRPISALIDIGQDMMKSIARVGNPHALKLVGFIKAMQNLC